MKTKYYVNTTGTYLGGWCGCVPDSPPDAVEVTGPPQDAAQVWDFVSRQWGAVPSPEPDAAALAAQVRAERNARLSACDWTQLADAPLTEAQRAAWAEYRQGLRDVPKQPGFPGAVQWPEVPR